MNLDPTTFWTVFAFGFLTGSALVMLLTQP
jgi:hypothetical protein